MAARPFDARASRAARSTRITVTSCASVNTHSAITVDVARNTKAGVMTVAAASSNADGGATSRWRVKSNQHAAPDASIAITETSFSHSKLPGNDGENRKIAARIAGNPGGTAGMISVAAELINRKPRPSDKPFASTTYHASSTIKPTA